MHKKILSMLFTSLLVGLVLADDSKEVYPFEDVVQEERFLSLLNELRCPKCQGSNLSGSNAPIAIDLKREGIYITNIIPWRPPNNRTPTNDEILQCLPFVQKIIEIVNPNLILLLGATSAKAILNSNLSIAKLRGEWHEYQSINHKEKVNCLVTYHPAFLLRSPNYKKESWKDLQEFQRNFK